MPYNNIEYFQVYTGETRALPLRTITASGVPFSLVSVTEIEARFKKADGGVLSKRMSPIKQVTKFNFSQIGSFYDVVGNAKAIQLYNAPAVGHYFWFNVTDGPNTQIDPFLVGVGHQVNILMADSPVAIATKFFTEVALVVAAFTATNAVNQEVIVTNVTGGVLTSPVSVVGTPCVMTVTTAGLASGITIIDDELGKYVVTLSASESSLLLVGERQSFAVIITLPFGTRKVNYRNALTIERQAV